MWSIAQCCCIHHCVSSPASTTWMETSPSVPAAPTTDRLQAWFRRSITKARASVADVDAECQAATASKVGMSSSNTLHPTNHTPQSKSAPKLCITAQALRPDVKAHLRQTYSERSRRRC